MTDWYPSYSRSQEVNTVSERLHLDHLKLPVAFLALTHSKYLISAE